MADTSFTAILLHAENNYESLARTFMDMHRKGEIHPKHLKEMETERTIVNTLQIIGRDPEGFKAWAAGTYRRFGAMGARTDASVVAMEAILRGEQK